MKCATENKKKILKETGVWSEKMKNFVIHHGSKKPANIISQGEWENECGTVCRRAVCAKFLIFFTLYRALI